MRAQSIFGCLLLIVLLKLNSKKIKWGVSGFGVCQCRVT